MFCFGVLLAALLDCLEEEILLIFTGLEESYF